MHLKKMKHDDHGNIVCQLAARKVSLESIIVKYERECSGRVFGDDNR